MLKKIAKSAALFFAVGVALALVAPPLAGMLGAGVIGEAAMATATATPVIWTGVFFGAFGAINTALEPVFSKLFRDEKPEVAEVPPARAKEAAKTVQLMIIRNENRCHHRDVVAASREPQTERGLS